MGFGIARRGCSPKSIVGNDITARIPQRAYSRRKSPVPHATPRLEQQTNPRPPSRHRMFRQRNPQKLRSIPSDDDRV